MPLRCLTAAGRAGHFRTRPQFRGRVRAVTRDPGSAAAARRAAGGQSEEQPDARARIDRPARLCHILMVARSSLRPVRAAARVAWLLLAALAPACGGSGAAGPVAWPTLAAGDRYFTTGGRMAPLFMRNITAAAA